MTLQATLARLRWRSGITLHNQSISRSAREDVAVPSQGAHAGGVPVEFVYLRATEKFRSDGKLTFKAHDAARMSPYAISGVLIDLQPAEAVKRLSASYFRQKSLSKFA